MPEHMTQEEERLKEIRQHITDLQMAKIKVLSILYEKMREINP